MMRISFASAALLISNLFISACGPGATHLGGQPAAATTDYGTLRTTDSDGHEFLAGTFSQTQTLGRKVLSSVGDVDLYLAKYDGAQGALLWAVSFGSTGLDYPLNFAAD